jgi:PiT family inorganic phosphate transporter
MPEINATVVLVFFIVLVALVFDFTNGFHDAANSIATVVSTRVLSPRAAVVWAAVFNFVAFAIFGTRVAKTIGGDLVRIDLISQDLRLYVLCAGLMGAIAWNLVTWYLGLPTSSSHALVGGYAGAAMVAYQGFRGLLKPEGWIKTLIFIVASPVIGFIMGFALMVAVYWIFHRWTPAQVDKTFRRGQLISAAAYSLGHGGNDAQKTMGIIVMLLSVAGHKTWAAPDPHSWANSLNFFGHTHSIAWWIILICHFAIATGRPDFGRKELPQRLHAVKQPVGGACPDANAIRRQHDSAGHGLAKR